MLGITAAGFAAAAARAAALGGLARLDGDSNLRFTTNNEEEMHTARDETTGQEHYRCMQVRRAHKKLYATTCLLYTSPSPRDRG